jgi:hypothetical protein
MRTLRSARILVSLLAPLATLAAADSPANQALSVAVLDGEGAINNTKSGFVTLPIVEVRDTAMRPVAGADVVFQLPASGPGGTFKAGGAEAHAKTNATGQARIPEFVPNDREGRFFIQVTARLGDREGSTRIGQANSATTSASRPAVKNRSVVWRVLAVAGGGAITVGAIMLSRGGGGGDSSGGGGSTGGSGPASITLNPGTITVGGPR